MPNTGFVAIAAGVSYGLALKADGSIAAWGLNDHGQCNGTSPNADIVAIAASDLYAQALKANGSIISWGHNSHGVYNVPPPNKGFRAIAVGHSLTAGLFWCAKFGPFRLGVYEACWFCLVQGCASCILR
jgi:hypothetical protein